MNENYKGKLQEYCQSQGLPFPKYGIVTQSGPPHCLEFEAYVQIGNEQFIGDNVCRTKKEAEQSAAQVACATFSLVRQNRSVAGSVRRIRAITNPIRRLALSPPPPPPCFSSRVPKSMKHMPDQYSESETYIINIIRSQGGRIRKIWAPDDEGNYQFEITGTYRYCENLGQHHKKNHVYFLVNPIRRTYSQKCHDPDCLDFQSPIRTIPRNDRSDPGKRKSIPLTHDSFFVKREKYY